MKALGDKLVESVKSYVAKAIDARAAELQARADKTAVALESAERRLSRHAEHLSRLESRIKALEGKP